MKQYSRKKYILMNKQRRAFILSQIVVLSFGLIGATMLWMGSQVHYQTMQKREYLFWLRKSQAVHYVRTTKNLKVDRQGKTFPRVIRIEDKGYYVRVSEYQIVRVPKLSN